MKSGELEIVFLKPVTLFWYFYYRQCLYLVFERWLRVSDPCQECSNRLYSFHPASREWICTCFV